MMAFSAVEGNGGVPVPVGLSGVNLDEWLSENLNVAVCSFFLFLLVQGIGGFRAKVEWVALVHSIITGVGSIHCIYLDQFHAETMTGTFDPLRIIRCDGPLTNVHKFLPSISLGYGLFDINYGIQTRDITNLIHGVALTTIMFFVIHWGHPEAITPMLIMEVSGIFLNLRKCAYFSERTAMACEILFAVSFFVCRLIVATFLWCKFLYVWKSDPEQVGSCFPEYFAHVVFCFGLLFHGLNLFWQWKIILMIKRKFSKSKPE